MAFAADKLGEGESRPLAKAHAELRLEVVSVAIAISAE